MSESHVMPGLTGHPRLAIFCSSSSEIDPKYAEAARQVVRAAVSKGYTIVSGGTTRGTMGVISEGADRIGAHHIGVIPKFFEKYHYPGKMDTVWTTSMSERKMEMIEDSAATLALPGGIGTMDELFEAYVLAKLGKYSGRVIVLNLEGFYDPLIAMLRSFVDKKTMTEQDFQLLEIYDTVEALVSAL